MAWNGSKGGSNRPIDNRQPYKGRRVLLITALAALVAVIAGLVIWGLGKNEDVAPAEATEAVSRGIKEVTAPPIAHPTVETNNPHKGEVFVRGNWYPEYNEKGGRIWITKNSVRYHTPVVVTNRMDSARIRPERQYFDNRAEQEIAIFLNTPLGTGMIGKRTFGKEFEREFLKSISNPIIISKDDPEDVAALKHAVIEAKKEMKARYDAGESVADIMNQTYREMRDLASYRDDLRRELQRAIREAKGDAEQTKIIYDAANKMLAERGLLPIREPVLLKHKLMLDKQ